MVATMMALRTKGYNCCGLTEVIVGGVHSVDELRAEIKYTGESGGALIATTIAGDAGYGKVEKLLKKAGFRFVTRFKNQNSGNILKLWVMVPKKRPEPYW